MIYDAWLYIKVGLLCRMDMVMATWAFLELVILGRIREGGEVRHYFVPYYTS